MIARRFIGENVDILAIVEDISLKVMFMKVVFDATNEDKIVV